MHSYTSLFLPAILQRSADTRKVEIVIIIVTGIIVTQRNKLSYTDSLELSTPRALLHCVKENWYYMVDTQPTQTFLHGVISIEISCHFMKLRAKYRDVVTFLFDLTVIH